MKKLITYLTGAVLILLSLTAIGLFVIAPPIIDKGQNKVVPHDPWPVSAEAQALHDDLLVADLHADTLLWKRNPAWRYSYGQTDLPRWREGGFFMQVFSATTKSPKGQNYEANAGDTDNITLLAQVQLWPTRTWGSLEERARFQAERLQKLERDDPDFYIIRTKGDIQTALGKRRSKPNVMTGLLLTEGSHPLEGDIAAIDRLYADGYRMMGLQHFFDNELGGSLHGLSNAGLTEFGKQAVDRMEEKGIIIDVAHSSEAVVRDVLDRTERPLVVSHTGFKGACDSHRNISDELMAEIAAGGGLLGVGFWDDAVCDATPDGVARMIVYGIETFGEDAIALGSDFDGAVETYFDASEMAALTDALLRAGLTKEQVAKVMGGNQIRFLSMHLPD